ncbi:MAG: hypothetical protein JNM70_04775 [Anaerolineae bacterium]|nr:hypothetical protein [Anaerolineae bacterium]
MSIDEKWIFWESPVEIITSHMKELIPQAIKAISKVGCFRFDDGTTQNWKLDQLYDSGTQASIAYFSGFTLANSQKLALAATACPLLFVNNQVDLCDIYLQSPDLTLEPNWQQITGFSLDLQRCIGSPCGEPKTPKYFAQLQLFADDLTDNSHHQFAEWNAATNSFKFNPVALNQPYHFVWKVPTLAQRKWQIKSVRVRLTMPNVNKGIGAGECAIRGSWLIGNVCPEK